MSTLSTESNSDKGNDAAVGVSEAAEEASGFGFGTLEVCDFSFNKSFKKQTVYLMCITKRNTLSVRNFGTTLQLHQFCLDLSCCIFYS